MLMSVLLVSHSVCGQPDKAFDLRKKAKEKIDLIFKDCHAQTPGYGIGISIHGQQVYTKGYGSANLDYELPITPESSFDIASVSKQFTAAAIALLVLDGKLSLEDPASDYIPQLSKYTDTIRVKHLVYNTSGLIDYHRLPRSNGTSWITFNYFAIDECIAASISVDTLAFKPESRWDYCNVNFMLLTKIVEKITGIRFSEYLRKNLFEPLGMNNTFVNDDITNVIPNRVTPYNLRTDESIRDYSDYGMMLNRNGKYIQHPRNSPHYGGSGIVTTVNDLLKWSANMVTKKIGGQSFFELLHHTPAFQHGRNNQAMGLYFGNYRERKTIAWDGGDWGISSQLIRFPDAGVAIVVLSNIGSGEAYRQANKIADVLIEGGYL
jgi:CubicO group peptidase (beta-lactamase class C family)